MILKHTWLFALFCAAWTLGAGNLVTNPSFRAEGKKLPGFGLPSAPVWQAADGVLSLREDGKKYTSAVACTIPVDGFKSYRIGFEARPTNLAKMAGVYYYWLDGKGKIISRARFVKQFKGTSADFEKVSAQVTPDEPAKTGKLMVCFAVYHAENGGGRIEYRNPVVEVADGKAVPVPVAAQKKSPERVEGLNYSYHFTSRNPGTPCTVEPGRPGFFHMASKTGYGKPFTLRVEAPAQVRFELYLLPVGGERTQLIASSGKNLWHVPAGMDHRAFGNALLFKALPGAPQKFSVKLLFTDAAGKELCKANIPVEQLPPVGKVRLAALPKLSSWYAYPVCRTELKPGTLMAELFNYWNDCGFRGANQKVPGTSWESLLNYTHILSYFAKDAPQAPAVVTAGGARGELICPSHISREFMVNEMKRKNAITALTQGAPRVVSDYEPYAGRNGFVTAHCFCDRCRSAFARENQLGSVPDTRTILTRYEKQWIAFRLRRRAAVTRAMGEAVRAVNPRARFALCSMPSPGRDEVERYSREYGIDLALHDSAVDVHMMMNYSPGTDFYRRLERDVVRLKKPMAPVFDNGWGVVSGYYPERSHLQLFAAAFCGVPEVCFGAGLINMDGAMLRAVREALELAARCGGDFRTGKIVENAPFTFDFGRDGARDAYVLRRDLGNGDWLFLAINNHPSKTLFGTLKGPGAGSFQELTGEETLSPDGKRKSFSEEEVRRGIALMLPPFGKMLIRSRADGKTSFAKLRNVADVARAAQRQQARFAAMSRPQSQYGMSTRMLPDEFLIATPAQKLRVNLAGNAAGAWTAGGRPVAEAVALEALTSPILSNCKDLRAEFVGSAIHPDRVEAQFVTRVKEYAYEGLAIHKTYRVYRDRPEIEVALAVVPEKGYRYFQLRVVNIANAGRDETPVPYPAGIAYRVPTAEGVVIDRHGDNRVYCRSGVRAVFAKEGPVASFSGGFAEAFSLKTGETLRAEFGHADELFFWRRGNDATLEWIYAPAYPDRDPHKVKVWRTVYRLRYRR